jgi:hypothetical protein
VGVRNFVLSVGDPTNQNESPHPMFTIFYFVLAAVPFLYICYMKAIVVTPKSDNEFKFVADLFKKLGIGTSTLTKAEIEDIGLLRLMNNVDMSKQASRTEIMKKLTA